MNDESKKPARSTLETVPDRVSRFLRGLAHNGRIRSALASEGYEDSDHQEGWNRFHAVNGYTPSPTPTIDRTSGLAMAELDRLDAGLIDKIDATLVHRFPAQRDAVLQGLVAGERAVAVANVKTILARLSTLESSSDSAAGEALARLAKVKIDPAERARLATLVKSAEAFESESGGGVESDESRWARLEPSYLALWAWFDEWSRAANRAIQRRDWLVTLGLAKRRQARDAEPAPVDGPAGDDRDE